MRNGAAGLSGDGRENLRTEKPLPVPRFGARAQLPDRKLNSPPDIAEPRGELIDKRLLIGDAERPFGDNPYFIQLMHDWFMQNRDRIA